MTNQFPGLARGPIDHQSSSVINVISNQSMTMGSSVKLLDPTPSSELLPRIIETLATGEFCYGIVVGGDADGIYGDGSSATDDSTRATVGAGQGAVVVTQGRCLARVEGVITGPTPTAIGIGDALTPVDTPNGLLQKASTGEIIVARALQSVASGDTDMIAVDVQRGGLSA